MRKNIICHLYVVLFILLVSSQVQAANYGEIKSGETKSATLSPGNTDSFWFQVTETNKGVSIVMEGNLDIERDFLPQVRALPSRWIIGKV